MAEICCDEPLVSSPSPGFLDDLFKLIRDAIHTFEDAIQRLADDLSRVEFIDCLLGHAGIGIAVDFSIGVFKT